MQNVGLIKTLMNINVYIELAIRWLYWKNVKYLKSLNANGVVNYRNDHYIDFNNIILYLKFLGVNQGDLLIVHSSYVELLNTKKEPNEIISILKDLVGENGTIAMPAIRSYKDEPKYIDYLKTDMTKITCTYDVRKTKVWTGILPATMLKMPMDELH